MKASTITRRLENFHRTVQTRRRAWEVPSVAVAVVAGGETVFAEGLSLIHI